MKKLYMRKFVVITSINYPAIKKFSTTKDWQVILVADLKTQKIGIVKM